MSILRRICFETNLNSLISPYCRIYASVNRVTIGSGYGLALNRRQAIMQTDAVLLSIGPLGTNFTEIQIKIRRFSFTKIHLKMSSAKMAAILSRGRWFKCHVNPLVTSQHWSLFQEMDWYHCALYTCMPCPGPRTVLYMYVRVWTSYICIHWTNQ